MRNTRFNLLPHRQMSKDVVRRVFARQAAVSICAGLLVSAVGALVIDRSISTKRNFIDELGQTIESMVPEYEESLRLEQQYQRLVLRQKVIERLDARRSTSVLILNDLATALPKEVYLLRMSEDGLDFTVDGKSIDVLAIARFFERLSASNYLQEVKLGEIRIQDQDDVAAYSFSIAGKVQLPNIALPQYPKDRAQ